MHIIYHFTAWAVRNIVILRQRLNRAQIPQFQAIYARSVGTSIPQLLPLSTSCMLLQIINCNQFLSGMRSFTPPQIVTARRGHHCRDKLLFTYKHAEYLYATAQFESEIIVCPYTRTLHQYICMCHH